MSPSRQILVGLAAGVALGLFLGELAAPLQVVADAYVRLLQMTVLPYVTVSLVAGLGSLSKEQAKVMFTRVGAVLLAVWTLSVVLAFSMALSFPAWETASFFSTSQLQPAERFDFLDLYIPTNPFHSLANSVVPAVVLFCGVVGVALIGMKDKQRVLEPLHVLGGAIAEVNRFVVKLTPVGLFAIAASLAGTMRAEDLERIEIYLLAYAAVALLLMLWGLPALVSTFTPAGYREVVAPARAALLTAFATGSLFVVLPQLGECARRLLERHAPERPGAQELPDVIVPASFNFPHSAKLLSLSFIPFAAWFTEVTIGGFFDYVKLAGVGLLSFFGSLNAAVPYLLDLYRIPQDTFQLFLATGVVNSRVGSAVAAMHTLVVAVLGSFAVCGLVRVSWARLLRYLVVTAALTFVTIGGLRVLFSTAFEQEYNKDDVLASMHSRRSAADATVHLEAVAPIEETREGPLLDRIRARGRVRVGYRLDNPPYSFLNGRGELVGLEVEMAQEIASVLDVSLELVPIRFMKYAEEINEGCCDVLMAGVLVTPERAERITFSDPYMEEHLAFLVPDDERARFGTRASLRSSRPLRIGAFSSGAILDRLRSYVPEAEIVIFESRDEFDRFVEGGATELDGVLIPAERGAVWTLRHPRLAVVIPDPPMLTLPLAFAVGEGDEGLRLFLNAWIDLQRRNGTIDALRDYWVYGKDAEPRLPRWSVVRDVLGWVD
jgi:Na+/H+-dicarboxylate symporter